MVEHKGKASSLHGPLFPIMAQITNSVGGRVTCTAPCPHTTLALTAIVASGLFKSINLPIHIAHVARTYRTDESIKGFMCRV